MRYEEIEGKSEELFRRLTGLKKETFAEANKILKEAEEIKMRLGGRAPSLSMENRLLLACGYWREYRTYEHIAATYGITKSTAQRVITWIENTLIRSAKFKLPGKKALTGTKIEWEVIIVDTTESPIQRAQKKQQEYYSGKKNDIH